MRASSVRISDAIGMVGDEEGARGLRCALTIQVAACVSKGWERVKLVEVREEGNRRKQRPSCHLDFYYLNH
jgi:hypothetical protein